MCEKSLSVHGDCGDFRVDLDGQSRLRIRQKYFSVNEEYANRHKTEIISSNFRLKETKFLIQNHLTRHDRMGKKPFTTVPLKAQSIDT